MKKKTEKKSCSNCVWDAGKFCPKAIIGSQRKNICTEYHRREKKSFETGCFWNGELLMYRNIDGSVSYA